MNGTYVGFTFADIDECLTDNGGCGSICTNQIGTRECTCAEGEIDVDGEGVRCGGMLILFIPHV